MNSNFLSYVHKFLGQDSIILILILQLAALGTCSFDASSSPAIIDKISWYYKPNIFHWPSFWTTVDHICKLTFCSSSTRYLKI